MSNSGTQVEVLSDDTGELPFPFTIGAPRWEITQEIRDRYELRDGTSFDFGIRFADGSCFTELRYRQMLLVTQKFLRELWQGTGKSSTYQKWIRLSQFIRFLVDVRKVDCYSAAWGIDEYVMFRKRVGKLAPGGRKSKGKARSMKEATLNDYLKLVKNLWRFSHEMPFGLRIEPWVGRSGAQVARVKTHGASNQVRPFTLGEFAGFIRIALSDIEKVDEICSLLRSGTRWDVRLAAVARLRTAASVVMFAFVGMRPEEAYRLPYDCLRKGKLATEDGVVEVVWLCGRIYKKKPPGGVPHRWLAADEVVKAVLALRRLWRTLDAALKKPTEEGGIPEKTAPAVESSRGFLFPKLRLAGKNTGLATKTGLVALKVYVSSPEFAEVGIRPSAVNHQRFRPTLARAFARLRLGDVRYFMSHFGHEHWTTTEGYFLTFADDELQGDVDRQVKSEAQAIIDTILSSPVPLLGGKGEQFEVLRRSYPVMTFKDRKDVVRTMERGYKIRLGPQALCMVEKNGEFCPADCLYEQERCLHCQKGVVGYGHVEAWKDMYARGTDFLSGIPAESPAATVTRANLREIKDAILTLGGEVPR